MNSVQLNKIMKTQQNTKPYYLGTFSVNNLPRPEYPSCFIFNNQKSIQPGQHWIAIYFSKNKIAEFFDSFGNSPKFYGIEKYLLKNSKSYKWNTKILQSKFSPYCGLYCALYLIIKCKNKSLNFFLRLFQSPINNDNYLKKIIKKYL